MISLQTSKEILSSSEESLSSKKRKWDDNLAEEIPEKPHNIKTMKHVFDSTIIQNQAQFPLEWQRCLDIKSGQIYFYNTRTNKRATLGDPTSILEQYNHPPAPMSLELELNPPCQSNLGKHDDHSGNNTTSIYSKNDHFIMDSNTMKDVTGGLARSPSWLSFDQGDQQEMVTAVCKKCYMLVMMSKSSPSCPNCKFLHPPPAPEPISSKFDQEVEG